MNILLVVPPSTMEEQYGSFQEAGALYPSIGLSYIAAAAERTGHQVTVIDAEAERLSLPEIRQALARERPQVIGMQTFCANLDRCYAVAKLCKEVLPESHTVLGGVQVTLFPLEAMSHPEIDFVVYGEGDATFTELLQSLAGGLPLELVEGIVWRREGLAVKNPARSLVLDLDELPLPALQLFPLHRYHSSSQIRGERTLLMFTSRGCPYHCSYCSGNLIFGRSFRYSSTARVVAEMRRLKEQFGVDGIQFYDETFTVNRKRVMELCAALRREQLGLEWACFTRVDVVDEELLQVMKAAGCYQIFFGVETGVPRLLEIIDKGTTLEQARHAFRLCRRVGIETVASFMLTLPTETEAETQQSIRFGLELDPDYVYWLTFTPYPGTRLSALAQQSGTILEVDYAKYNVFNQIVYLPEGRTEAEIKQTLAAAYRRFYFRPQYLWRRLQSFRRLPRRKVWNLVVGGLRTFLRRRV